jgi:hypothetical protein
MDDVVTAGTGSIMLRTASGAVVASVDVQDTAHVVVDGALVTIDPGIELPAASGFYLEIGAGALRDQAGNAFAGLSGPTAYNFSTTVDDHDAGIGNNGVLQLGGAALGGAIEVAGDIDRLTLDLVAGQTVDIQFTEDSAASGLVNVVTPDGRWRVGSYGSFTYKAIATGTHYLDVSLYGEDTGTYSIQVATAVGLVGQASGLTDTSLDLGA